MRKVTILLLIIPLVYLFAGCAKEGQKGAYLAKVGNVQITQADFERELKNLPSFAQKIFEGKEGKEKFLNELVKRELLYQEALKKGLDNNPEYKRKVEEFKKITLISQLLETEITSKAEVTDQDVKNYYEKHKEDFSPFLEARVSLIRVKTEDEANKIRERLVKGEDFAKIAKSSSIDQGSAKNGGDLGYLSRNQLTPELEAVVSKLNTGEISEPIKVQNGYDIVKITDKKLGKQIEFEKVKNLIKQHLASEKQKDAFDTYIEDLKKSYKVEINNDALSKLLVEEKGETAKEPEGKSETQSAPKENKK
jgi:EpsD family peptidyl-prolyl cis-trans isomerase